jgi:dienelactone hydrolase
MRATRAAARPLWITTAAGPIFAWHHPPHGRADRQAAVILCRPFGYEAQCTERAFRKLAERLAAEGFHAVRVDYHGTGNSSGSDADEDRLGAWVGSIRAAIEWARRSLDVGKVSLFGSRVGALLALQAASEGDVDALALLAPPASGRAWLREARALQAMTNASNELKGWPTPRNGEESAGFLLTKATAAALGQLDPASTSRTARAILLIARDDLPGGEDKLANGLTAHGAEVTVVRTPGYGAMIHSDPRLSVVPDEAWAAVTRWLGAQDDAGQERREAAASKPALAASYPVVATVRENEGEAPVREEAVDMGGLFGIVTEPSHPRWRNLPTIVLHNIGANSHVGPSRMYVTMARRWAGLGYRVLRFDVAGLGESPADSHVSENQVYSDGTARDPLRALDFLAKGVEAPRFVCVGLCSGAFFSFWAAVGDPRVVGVMLLNLQRFHWRLGDPVDAFKREIRSTQFYWNAAFGADAWVRLARGKIDVPAIVEGMIQNRLQSARKRVGRALMGEGDVPRGFRALLRRGTDVLVVVAADDGARNTIDANLGTNASHFRRERGFRFEIIDGADHTFSPVACQDMLLSLLTVHLVTRFGVDHEGAPGDRASAVTLQQAAAR